MYFSVPCLLRDSENEESNRSRRQALSVFDLMLRNNADARRSHISSLGYL